MTTISRARDARSGGKIYTRRRNTSVPKTPYDRPAPPPLPPPQTQNPNWLTALIFPATRKIAAGAGQLISSIFTADTSSSSSSSYSDSDSASDDDVDGSYNGEDVPLFEPSGLKEKNGTSEMVECSGEDPQLTKEKSSTKPLIEQLLMQETYSREECDRLINIIRSRVIDFPCRTVGPDAMQETPDIRNQALAEAKKWLEEKKVQSSTKSDLDSTTLAFNSAVLPLSADGTSGSPVDMAKSYMQRRPPWASPRHIESRTPTPIFIDLFDETTPYSLSNTSYLTQKRDSLSAGSWNIREEIRRVRSKATENMLRTTPSTKNYTSSFPLEPKSTHFSFIENNNATDLRDKIYEPNSLASEKAGDASLTMADGLSPCGFPAVELTQPDAQNDALPSEPAIVVSEPKKDSQAIEIEKEWGAVSESRHDSPDPQPLMDPISRDGNTCTTNEEVAISSIPDAAETNGLPSPKNSLSAGIMDIEETTKEPNTDKPRGNAVVDETCEILSEVSVEVPDVNEINDRVASPSAPQEEMMTMISEELTMAAAVNEEEEQNVVHTKTPRGKKPGRGLARKGNRGRGK